MNKTNDFSEETSDAEDVFLATYDPDKYARPSVAVDIALFTIRNGALNILLIERAGHPNKGHWALPGGFVESDEDVTDAAYRELVEETGIEMGEFYLEQLKTYGAPQRDPRTRVISVAHFALVGQIETPHAGSDAAQARFWSIEDLTELPLAFDHAIIIADALERVRSKLEYTSIATSLLEEPFTISELRKVYEAVWGTPIADASNFARKLRACEGFLQPSGSATSGASKGGRPAQLYGPGVNPILYPPFLRPETSSV